MGCDAMPAALCLWRCGKPQHPSWPSENKQRWASAMRHMPAHVRDGARQQACSYPLQRTKCVRMVTDGWSA